MEIDKIKKQFGNEASNYTKFRLPYSKELYTLLFSLIHQKNGKVLDIACGTGKSTEPLLESGLGLEVYGCDHDELMIKEAQKQAELKKLAIQYAVADAAQLPFEDETFDVITVGTAFHFFADEMAMKEIKRVLKPGGLFFTFWTLTTKDTPEEDGIPGSIFQSRGWIKIPSELRDLQHVSAFLTKEGLDSVSTASIPFTYNTTVEERVGLQTTSGTYELLSAEEKKKFLNEVEEALTKNLGSRTHFTLEEELQACYGFKV
jgi:ubiquinone/menaquinone biosynthesis C-methylase UbiE